MPAALTPPASSGSKAAPQLDLRELDRFQSDTQPS
jgi:hypothetical protein